VYAFDADTLIYAAIPHHSLGRRVRALLPDDPAEIERAEPAVGSVLLLPELLSKPIRDEAREELHALASILARLDLRPVDRPTADLAAALGAEYRLKAADAVHLATAVAAGANHFVTNNRRHFGRRIAEIDVVYPADLPEV
jgi:predicted nucleic acid-binding protein